MSLVIVKAQEEGVGLPLLVGVAASLKEASGVVLRHLELEGMTWEDDVPVGGVGDRLLWGPSPGGGPGGYYLEGRVSYEALLRRASDGVSLGLDIFAYEV
jgi:hypothetical protein